MSRPELSRRGTRPAVQAPLPWWRDVTPAERFNLAVAGFVFGAALVWVVYTAWGAL